MTTTSRTAIRMLLVCLWATLVIVPASGQTYQTFQAEKEQILSRAKWRVGPLRIFPVLMFRNIGYDSNVYSQRNDTNPIADYTAAGGIQLNTHLLYRNWLILTVVEHPEYVFFIKEKRERSLNNQFSPSLKLLLFNSFALTGNYQYRKERRRASGEFDVRADEKRKAYNGQFFYETSRRTALGVSSSVEKIFYENISQTSDGFDIATALNRTEKNIAFETYYRIFTDSLFFVSGGRTEYEFENVMTQWRNSRSAQIYSGIRFPEIGRVRGAFSLGYKRLAPLTKGKKEFSGLVGNTNLNVRAGKFSIRIQYARDSIFSFEVQNIFFVENRWGLGLSVYPLIFLRLDYDFARGTGSYPEPIQVRGSGGQTTEILRKDIYVTHSAGLVIRVIRNTGIGMLFNYWQRKSNSYMEQRSRWFLSGYLTFEF